MTENIEKLFSNQTFLELALTHKSWVNEHPHIRESNERVEFLGDAVLEFIVSKAIYSQLPDKEEGYLTALRANLVNTVNLAQVAEKLNLGSLLLLSKGEEESGGRKNTSILANTVEAIIGGLFLDGGIDKAENFINDNLLVELTEKISQPLKDAKSRFQEYVQAEGFSAPKYEVVNESGPDHDKRFTMEVSVDGKSYGSGIGRNKSEAAQEAAKKALEQIEEKSS